MAIRYDAARKEFRLDTENTSYIMAVTGDGYLAHVYYGSRIAHPVDLAVLRLDEIPEPGVLPREKVTFLNALPMEYPTGGVGDYRESALDLVNEAGQKGCELFYDSYRIEEGAPVVTGLPSAFAGEENGVSTLLIDLKDPLLGVTVTLRYTVFPDEDVITRSARIENTGGQSLRLTRAFSACFDMDDRGYETLSLMGNWARERTIERRPEGYGVTSIGSVRGESSHQQNPFMALLTKGTDEKKGEVYGMMLLYSGNHAEIVEKNQFRLVRFSAGINPTDFTWRLGAGAVFETPEAALTYSAAGLGKMTRNYHDFIRGHIIRSPWKDRLRPILINNWEATYFDFDADKIYKIARDARSCGIEMMVLDDGWFGNRCDDNRALGDWFVNEEKIGSLKTLSERIGSLGMKFGLWFEPEMISPDSDLYREHPDWAFQIKGRPQSLSRNQLVLDITRKEVRDAVYGRVYNVLKSAKIDYVKWDMNRYLADIGSIAAGADGQGELFHRYVLALYEMQERLITDFPELLLENCSGGGGRFDAGELYYSPQIWCSDDTDAIERLRIQEGTALIYPMSTMGAHVSKCPNEQVGRVTPFETRANVALAGTYGYELNIDSLTEEERAMIPQQTERYHRYHKLIADGDYYRIHSWNDEEPYDCWMNAAKDGSEALVTYVQVLGRPSTYSEILRLEGLTPDAEYEIIEDPKREKLKNGYGDYAQNTSGWGDELMNVGLRVPPLGDFNSRLYHLVRK